MRSAVAWYASKTKEVATFMPTRERLRKTEVEGSDGGEKAGIEQ
eukprot:gene1727-biopygen11079